MFKCTLAALAVLLFSACAGAPASHNRDAPAARRFVALVPSLAEDLYAIGVGSRVVGVSKFTEVAPNAVPRIADFQSVDAEKIVALGPDVVVAIPAQARLVEPLQHAGVRVEFLRDDSFGDIFSGIQTLGSLAGQESNARALIARLHAKTARLREQTNTFLRRPAVFFALGTSPIWTVGKSSYLGHLVELAGGVDAAALPQAWGEYSEEALVRADPDAIIAAPGVRIFDVTGREPWRSLRAVREGHVFVVTDPRIEDALYRPGPRYNEGLHWLIERLKTLAN